MSIKMKPKTFSKLIRKRGVWLLLNDLLAVLFTL